MQKDQWINEVLESAKGSQKASPTPFLFEKITARIENGKKLSSPPQFNWAVSMAMVVLIVMNVLAVKSYLRQTETQNPAQNVSLNSEYNNSTIYNY